MADDYTQLQLVGRHVPDAMTNAQGVEASPQALGYDTAEPVTGMYEIGALVDGAFVPLMVEKASLVFDAIAVAKKNAPEPPPDEPVTTGPQTVPGSGAEVQQTAAPEGSQPQQQSDQPQG